MDIEQRVAACSQDLTPAERRAARVVVDRREVAVFASVADLARRARTSGPTVMRMANKLGFSGYAALKAAIQAEMSHRLRPAAELIQEQPPRDPLARALAVESENIRRTLLAVETRAFAAAVAVLADSRRRLWVLPSESAHGVCSRLAVELHMLREDVELLYGSHVRVNRFLGQLGPGDAVLIVDFKRYDRWVLETAKRAAARKAELLVLTDSRLSPYAGLASEIFVVSAEGSGPFDSHVGTLALFNALVAGVAARLQKSAAGRLQRIESAWRAADALLDA